MPITEAPGSLQNGNHLAIPKPTLMGPAIDVAPAETDGQLLVAGLQIPDAALARPQSNGYYVANKPMPITSGCPSHPCLSHLAFPPTL